MSVFAETWDEAPKRISRVYVVLELALLQPGIDQAEKVKSTQKLWQEWVGMERKPKPKSPRIGM